MASTLDMHCPSCPRSTRRTEVLARQLEPVSVIGCRSSGSRRSIFIGTDSGATTSKTGGIWDDETIISHELRQSSTNSAAGKDAVIKGWVDGINGFLIDNDLSWDQVRYLLVNRFSSL
jgi:hypothetical protein